MLTGHKGQTGCVARSRPSRKRSEVLPGRRHIRNFRTSVSRQRFGGRQVLDSPTTQAHYRRTGVRKSVRKFHGGNAERSHQDRTRNGQQTTSSRDDARDRDAVLQGLQHHQPEPRGASSRGPSTDGPSDPKEATHVESFGRRVETAEKEEVKLPGVSQHTGSSLVVSVMIQLNRLVAPTTVTLMTRVLCLF
jgi:hypothetical protein